MFPVVKIGILGFGTVGIGTVEVLKKNKKLFQERTDSNIEIEKNF